jgi:hypothetical protein
VINPQGADPETGLQRDDDDEGFLVRWSRRKQAGYRNQEHPSAPGPQTLPGEPLAADDLQQATPQRELTDADMPAVDSLDEKSDYAAFMSPGVSEKLRALALRKLFHLPDFHVPDGLDDYDDDFTQFAKLGHIVTREMERMLVRERRAAGATEAASETGQVDVESEAEAAQSDVADGMIAKAEDASSDGDEHSEQGGVVPISQDLNHKGHEALKGTTG